MLQTRVGLRWANLSAFLVVCGPAISASAQTPPPVGALPLVKLVPGAVDERALNGGGSIGYRIALTTGEHLKVIIRQIGMDVTIHAYGPSGDKLADFDSPNGTDGDEEVELSATTAGNYRLVVGSNDPHAPPGRFRVTEVEVLSPRRELERLAGLERERQAVSTWMRGNGTRFDDASSSSAAEVLALASATRGARVVGLGEVSHGSHEIFELKAHVVRILVEHLGFRKIALELDEIESHRINDYVHGIDGPPLVLKPWEVEEFVALLDWIRRYNASVAPAEQVSIVGVDGQDARAGSDTILAFLAKAAPERVADARDLFSRTVFPPWQLDRAKADALQARYRELFVFFEMNRAKLAGALGSDAYSAARTAARALLQPGEMYSYANRKEQWSVRDEYMATNLALALDGSPTRTIFWAHNAHVETSTGSTGSYLRGLYGTAYVAIGTTFGRGRYEAWDATTSKWTVAAYDAPPFARDSAEAVFERVGVNPLLVDYRHGTIPAIVSHWLATPHPHRVIGAAHTPAAEKGSTPPTVLADTFDAEMFVARSTPALPTSRMLEEYSSAPLPRLEPALKHK